MLGSGGIGIGGSLIFGTFLLTVPKSGLGVGIKLEEIPPLARGISGGREGCLENLSPKGAGGLFIKREGILLALFGLFSARSLSAKVPNFYPFESFFEAYYTRICLPAKYWLLIWEIAKSEELKLS